MGETKPGGVFRPVVARIYKLTFNNCLAINTINNYTANTIPLKSKAKLNCWNAYFNSSSLKKKCYSKFHLQTASDNHQCRWKWKPSKKQEHLYCFNIVSILTQYHQNIFRNGWLPCLIISNIMKVKCRRKSRMQKRWPYLPFDTKIIRLYNVAQF